MVYVGCAFHSSEVGSLGILVHLALLLTWIGPISGRCYVSYSSAACSRLGVPTSNLKVLFGSFAMRHLDL